MQDASRRSWEILLEQQNFCNNSEIFARIAKFSLCIEISLHSEFSLYSEISASCFCVQTTPF